MPEDIDIIPVIDRLSAEFDALLEEREEIRVKTAVLEKRAEEIDRKTEGIQQTLQGFHLYSLAQEEPTEIMKKTTLTLSDVMLKMQRTLTGEVLVAGPEIPKTLSECCRDILRKKRDWMSAIDVRAALLAAGFDFSKYTSNPLSSIHTTLKRLAPEELETDGQMYRWKANTK